MTAPLPIVERLRGYLTIFAGKPHFSNKINVHKASDLAEAADTIEQLYEALEQARIELTARGCFNNGVMDEVNAALAKARGQ